MDYTAFAFKSLTPVPPSRKEGAILKSNFLKRKYLIFPTIFCGLLIKYKPIILNENAVGLSELLLLTEELLFFSVFCPFGRKGGAG